ncbi:MAG TPA: hypothetical protein VLL52_20820 [Anaerolineae bacterium]|nr:hypothetical protein [Anaerolineae bacterium]
MAYFKSKPNCKHYPTKWDAALNQIKSLPNYFPVNQRWGKLKYHIEAKALQVFTMARRLIRSAEALAEPYGWKPIFVESSALLFPMIELVGAARAESELGVKKRVSQIGGHRSLDAGIRWLQDPNVLPTYRGKKTFQNDTNRLVSLEQYMVDHGQGPQVCELNLIRNYFLHGLKSHGDPTVSIADVMNYELPMAIAKHARFGLREYWRQLCGDDGSKWVERLADADIQPFIIQGSEIFEAGLIDPDILDFLEE